MNFNSVFSTANALYGIDEDPEYLMELALIAFGKINESKIKLHTVIAIPDPKDNSVELPCEANFKSYEDNVQIESVTYGFEDFKHITNISFRNYPAGIIEHRIEHFKKFEHEFYNSGKFAKFEQVGRKLYFKENYGPVKIVYKKMITDEEGLPELNEAQVNAIATYIAYAVKQKEAWATNNANLLQMSQYMYTKWLRECDQARVPEHISQNEMDEVLDSLTNYDRKVYGKSFKPIR